MCPAWGRSTSGPSGEPVGTPAIGAAAGSVSPERYTPKHLAERILASKSDLEGERKQVTVLFADLNGSIARAQDMVSAETDLTGFGSPSSLDPSAGGLFGHVLLTTQASRNSGSGPAHRSIDAGDEGLSILVETVTGVGEGGAEAGARR